MAQRKRILVIGFMAIVELDEGVELGSALLPAANATMVIDAQPLDTRPRRLAKTIPDRPRRRGVRAA